jgi:hypothetical protein
VFHLLIRFAPQPVHPTEIAWTPGLKQNALSHHLADLTRAGLTSVNRRGRSLHYSADLDMTKDLIGYLALDLGRARPDLLSVSPANPIRAYAAVTAAHWAFMLSDGALRMLVRLHFNSLGFTPVQPTWLFLFYGLAGIVTNLAAGWLSAPRLADVTSGV